MIGFFQRHQPSSAFRFLILSLSYAILLSFTLVVSYSLRFDFEIPGEFVETIPEILFWSVIVQLVFLYLFRQYAGLLTYFSVPDLYRIFFALSGAALVVGLVRYLGGIHFAPPRGVILIDFLLSFLAIAGFRLGLRLVRELFLQPEAVSSRNAKRVGIIGAGDAGAQLARELMAKRGLGLKPVAFFDDDRSKQMYRLHGIPVVGPPEDLIDDSAGLDLDMAIIAMPSVTIERKKEVIDILHKARLHFETVPSLDQLATGRVQITQLRPVEIQDLLGREPIVLEREPIEELIAGRSVMVTGAGGTIGSELCRQIAKLKPTKLILIEQSEMQMFLIEQELKRLGYREIIEAYVADILDCDRIDYIFRETKPELVFHAAAHKHVPLMEGQPVEAIRNNVFGTARLAEHAERHRVDRFVLISTDKAINPTNVMGATKRLAELYIQGLQMENSASTKFMAVRFGNVLGSSGSVIPTFKRQIAAGGPVTVTDPEVTRYFMTIPEAVGLVLRSATLGEGGEIFVLDMGESIKIVDLARQMIKLSGFIPDEEIEIEFIGLRPGEKLFEELRYDSEKMDRTAHAKVMRLRCEPIDLEAIRARLAKIEGRFYTASTDDLKHLLNEIVPEYQPFVSG